MLRRVKKYIQDNGMLHEGDRVLVCVSGGADSIALLDVLLRGGYRCVVAHCNFHLRGEESDRDEAFVRRIVPEIAARRPYNVEETPVYVKDFSTREYAEREHKSIELAARELRYQWFDELAHETGCAAIAVAHHQNDQAETVIMNLRRGAGLRGLCGMWPVASVPKAVGEAHKALDEAHKALDEAAKPLDVAHKALDVAAEPLDGKEIKLIRPLLCTTHDYICHYLRDVRKIEWVEDSTNTDTHYTRNKVRAELSTWSKAEIEHVAKTAEIVRAEVARDASAARGHDL